MHGVAVDPIVTNLTVFVLAVFVGYHVVWNVTPALHTPLMSVTNAISSVIVVGAILAAGAGQIDRGTILGAVAVALVAINTFGGFLVTERMLEMFKKKDRDGEVVAVTMSANQVALSYLVASVLFILALKGLSNPLTARRGNRFGIAGMTHRRAHHARDHPAHRSHDRRARRWRHRSAGSSRKRVADDADARTCGRDALARRSRRRAHRHCGRQQPDGVQRRRSRFRPATASSCSSARSSAR